MSRRLERLGITEGQAYTIAIGLIVGVVTAAIGIPPTLRDHHRRNALPRASSTTLAAPAPVGRELPATTSTAVVDVPALGVGGAIPFLGTPRENDTAFAPPAASATPAATPDGRPSAAGPASSSYADGGPPGQVAALASVPDPRAPHGIAVDPETGAFYVATDNGTHGPSKIIRYSPSGSVDRVYVVNGQPGNRQRGVAGLVLGADDTLYALDTSSGRILRLDLDTGRQRVVATLADLPTCTVDQSTRCELSPRDSAPAPTAAVFDADGNLFVADSGQGIVWKIDRDGDAAPWDRSVDYLSVDGDGPAGLQLDGDGNLLVAVTTSPVALSGAVYRVPVGPSGPGPHEELYRSDPNAGPTGLAVGASGRIYVTLAGANTVVVLGPDGGLTATVTSPEFAAPSGVAFRGHSLLVTNRSAATVVRVAVADSGTR